MRKHFLLSCQKENNTDRCVSSETTDPLNQLCDGNESDSFLPIASNNFWHLTDSDTTGTLEYLDINHIGLQEENEQTYHLFLREFNHYGGYYFADTLKLRVAENGDIYGKLNTPNEYLYLPHNLELGHSCEYVVPSSFHETREVVALSTNTFSTDSCDYTEYVVIEVGGGAASEFEVYAKGVGFVGYARSGMQHTSAISLN